MDYSDLKGHLVKGEDGIWRESSGLEYFEDEDLTIIEEDDGLNDHN